jgi:hypothetical protein
MVEEAIMSSNEVTPVEREAMEHRISARFFVNQIIEHGNVTQITVKMTPAYSEGQNKDYAKATPSGSFELNVDSELLASDFFRGILHANRSGEPTNLGIEMFAVPRGE